MKKLLQNLSHLVNQITMKFQWLPVLVARVTIGQVFISSGWGKLHNLPKVIDFFTELGIPAPQIQAPFAAGMEFLCGGCVLFGLFTEIVSIPLIIIMIVALITAKKADISSFDDITGMIEYLYIVILLWLGVFGGGPISLDRVIGFGKNRK